MIAAFLALMASLLWGSSDFLAGLQARRATVWAVALVSQATAFVAALVVLAVVSPPFTSAADLVAPAVAGFAITLSALSEYKAMALASMSVVAPIFAGAALVPVVWGLALGERPDALQLAGMALTVVGIVLISRPQRREPHAERRAGSAGILLALFAAFMVGVVLVAYGYGDDVDPYWSVATARFSALLLLVVVLVVRRPSLHLGEQSAPAAVVVGLFLVTANTLYTAATTLGLLSVVAVLGWLSPAVTVFWAQALLHERLRPLQWVAAAMVLAGVVGLALG
jgi:drug/metabolite transporter (DMT)-like permease